ncbi:hypothetical protein PM082_019590 [Marasmius tenuissimus]|nr:hypothetical protein PM082_019590 [Marasmius tenuissimus]
MGGQAWTIGRLEKKGVIDRVIECFFVLGEPCFVSSESIYTLQGHSFDRRPTGEALEIRIRDGIEILRSSSAFPNPIVHIQQLRYAQTITQRSGSDIVLEAVLPLLSDHIAIFDIPNAPSYENENN